MFPHVALEILPLCIVCYGRLIDDNYTDTKFIRSQLY